LVRIPKLAGISVGAALFSAITVIYGCNIAPTGEQTPANSPASMPSPALSPTATHGGHPPAAHEPSPQAAGSAALVLVRRLDGINQHEGGPGVVGERFGIFAISDDMDRDGVADLIIGAPRADVGGRPGSNEGMVNVLSGAALLKGAQLKDAILYQLKGEPTVDGTGEFGFRQSIATADFNRDGYPDLVVGAWLADPLVAGVAQRDAGTVFVFNGAALLRGASQDSALLYRLDGEPGSRLGRPAYTVGDINRDGTPDIFVGAHRASPKGIKNAGSGYLISGADFSILHRFDGLAPNDFLGRSVMAIGDLNRDGYPDLAVGASQGDGGQAGGIPPGPGYVNVYSGRDYSLMHRLAPPSDEPAGSFGQTSIYVSKPEEGVDFDGDGVPDVVVGSPEARAGLRGPTGKEDFPRTGSVYVYSGADFSLIRRFNGERGSSLAVIGTPSHESPQSSSPSGNVGDVFGDAVAIVPDMDGDGVPEIVVGAPRGDGMGADNSYPVELTDSGYAKIYSGRQGALLLRIDGAGTGTNMGHHVLSVGDLDKDGSPDLLIGSDLTDYGGIDAGSLYWYSIRYTKVVE